MIYKFKLRFPKNKVKYWSLRYDYKNEDVICNVLAPKIQRQKYLTKDDFMFLSRWKSPRPTKQAAKNDEAFIKEVTKISLTTTNPKLSIEILTLLKGVSWPVASTILHFGKDNEYPLMDYRALWSLSVDKPKVYNFEFWDSYTTYCKKLAKECGVSMRVLDRALWQYSKENQS
jgi:hypothetical protein